MSTNPQKPAVTLDPLYCAIWAGYRLPIPAAKYHVGRQPDEKFGIYKYYFDDHEEDAPRGWEVSLGWDNCDAAQKTCEELQKEENAAVAAENNRLGLTKRD